MKSNFISNILKSVKSGNRREAIGFGVSLTVLIALIAVVSTSYFNYLKGMSPELRASVIETAKHLVFGSSSSDTLSSEDSLQYKRPQIVEMADDVRHIDYIIVPCRIDTRESYALIDCQSGPVRTETLYVINYKDVTIQPRVFNYSVDDHVVIVGHWMEQEGVLGFEVTDSHGRDGQEPRVFKYYIDLETLDAEVWDTSRDLRGSPVDIHLDESLVEVVPLG